MVITKAIMKYKRTLNRKYAIPHSCINENFQLYNMLEMSTNELVQFLKNEILENPFLIEIEEKFFSKSSITQKELQIPDVLVQFSNLDNFYIKLNDYAIPQISLDFSSIKNLKYQRLSYQDKVFINNKIKQANSLIESIRKRDKLILRISNEVVCRQLTFFHSSKEEINDMTVLDIALTLNIPPNIVKKSILNKSIDTPSGLKYFSYFFKEKNKKIGNLISYKEIKNRNMDNTQQQKIFADVRHP